MSSLQMPLAAALLAVTLTTGHAAPSRKAVHHIAPARKSHAAAKAAKLPPAPEQDWFPDPTLAAQLGTETAFGVYTLRLPPGLTFIDQHRNFYTRHVEDATVYAGEPRPDGSRLQFFVTVASAGTNAIFTANATELMQRMDDKIFAHANAPIKSASVYGRINGLETLRQYFRIGGKNGPVHGFQYWMAGPTSAIVVVVMDTEPHSTESIPLAEASVLTLNKQ